MSIRDKRKQQLSLPIPYKVLQNHIIGKNDVLALMTIGNTASSSSSPMVMTSHFDSTIVVGNVSLAAITIEHNWLAYVRLYITILVKATGCLVARLLRFVV